MDAEGTYKNDPLVVIRTAGPGPGSGGLPYASPAALRAALTDKIKAAVTTDVSYGFGELARQIGYDRLLARLDWGNEPAEDLRVLKGATSLLARLRTGGRHSLDIDLYRKKTPDLWAAEQALGQAAAKDIGDFFTFDLRPATALADTAKGSRIPVIARLGPIWSEFHVDVVVGLSMTGQPDTVGPLTHIEIPACSGRPIGRIRSRITSRTRSQPHSNGDVLPPADSRPAAESRTLLTCCSSPGPRPSMPRRCTSPSHPRQPAGDCLAQRLHRPRPAHVGRRLANRRGQDTASGLGVPR